MRSNRKAQELARRRQELESKREARAQKQAITRQRIDQIQRILQARKEILKHRYVLLKQAERAVAENYTPESKATYIKRLTIYAEYCKAFAKLYQIDLAPRQEVMWVTDPTREDSIFDLIKKMNNEELSEVELEIIKPEIAEIETEIEAMERNPQAEVEDEEKLAEEKTPEDEELLRDLAQLEEEMKEEEERNKAFENLFNQAIKELVADSSYPGDPEGELASEYVNPESDIRAAFNLIKDELMEQHIDSVAAIKAFYLKDSMEVELMLPESEAFLAALKQIKEKNSGLIVDSFIAAQKPARAAIFESVRGDLIRVVNSSSFITKEKLQTVIEMTWNSPRRLETREMFAQFIKNLQQETNDPGINIEPDDIPGLVSILTDINNTRISEIAENAEVSVDAEIAKTIQALVEKGTLPSEEKIHPDYQREQFRKDLTTAFDTIKPLLRERWIEATITAEEKSSYKRELLHTELIKLYSAQQDTIFAVQKELGLNPDTQVALQKFAALITTTIPENNALIAKSAAKKQAENIAKSLFADLKLSGMEDEIVPGLTTIILLNPALFNYAHLKPILQNIIEKPLPKENRRENLRQQLHQQLPLPLNNLDTLESTDNNIKLFLDQLTLINRENTHKDTKQKVNQAIQLAIGEKVPEEKRYSVDPPHLISFAGRLLPAIDSGYDPNNLRADLDTALSGIKAELVSFFAEAKDPPATELIKEQLVSLLNGDSGLLDRMREEKILTDEKTAKLIFDITDRIKEKNDQAIINRVFNDPAITALPILPILNVFKKNDYEGLKEIARCCPDFSFATLQQGLLALFNPLRYREITLDVLLVAFPPLNPAIDPPLDLGKINPLIAELQQANRAAIDKNSENVIVRNLEMLINDIAKNGTFPDEKDVPFAKEYRPKLVEKLLDIFSDFFVKKMMEEFGKQDLPAYQSEDALKNALKDLYQKNPDDIRDAMEELGFDPKGAEVQAFIAAMTTGLRAENANAAANRIVDSVLEQLSNPNAKTHDKAIYTGLRRNRPMLVKACVEILQIDPAADSQKLATAFYQLFHRTEDCYDAPEAMLVKFAGEAGLLEEDVEGKAEIEALLNKLITDVAKVKIANHANRIVESTLNGPTLAMLLPQLAPYPLILKAAETQKQGFLELAKFAFFDLAHFQDALGVLLNPPLRREPIDITTLFDAFKIPAEMRDTFEAAALADNEAIDSLIKALNDANHQELENSVRAKIHTALYGLQGIVNYLKDRRRLPGFGADDATAALLSQKYQTGEFGDDLEVIFDDTIEDRLVKRALQPTPLPAYATDESLQTALKALFQADKDEVDDALHTLGIAGADPAEDNLTQVSDRVANKFKTQITTGIPDRNADFIIEELRAAPELADIHAVLSEHIDALREIILLSHQITFDKLRNSLKVIFQLPLNHENNLGVNLRINLLLGLAIVDFPFAAPEASTRSILNLANALAAAHNEKFVRRVVSQHIDELSALGRLPGDEEAKRAEPAPLLVREYKTAQPPVAISAFKQDLHTAFSENFIRLLVKQAAKQAPEDKPDATYATEATLSAALKNLYQKDSSAIGRAMDQLRIRRAGVAIEFSRMITEIIPSHNAEALVNAAIDALISAKISPIGTPIDDKHFDLFAAAMRAAFAPIRHYLVLKVKDNIALDENILKEFVTKLYRLTPDWEGLDDCTELEKKAFQDRIVEIAGNNIPAMFISEVLRLLNNQRDMNIYDPKIYRELFYHQPLFKAACAYILQHVEVSASELSKALFDLLHPPLDYDNGNPDNLAKNLMNKLRIVYTGELPAPIRELAVLLEPVYQSRLADFKKLEEKRIDDAIQRVINHINDAGNFPDEAGALAVPVSNEYKALDAQGNSLFKNDLTAAFDDVGFKQRLVQAALSEESKAAYQAAVLDANLIALFKKTDAEILPAMRALGIEGAPADATGLFIQRITEGILHNNAKAVAEGAVSKVTPNNHPNPPFHVDVRAALASEPSDKREKARNEAIHNELIQLVKADPAITSDDIANAISNCLDPLNLNYCNSANPAHAIGQIKNQLFGAGLTADREQVNALAAKIHDLNLGAKPQNYFDQVIKDLHTALKNKGYRYTEDELRAHFIDDVNGFKALVELFNSSAVQGIPPVAEAQQKINMVNRLVSLLDPPVSQDIFATETHADKKHYSPKEAAEKEQKAGEEHQKAIVEKMQRAYPPLAGPAPVKSVEDDKALYGHLANLPRALAEIGKLERKRLVAGTTQFQFNDIRSIEAVVQAHRKLIEEIKKDATTRAFVQGNKQYYDQLTQALVGLKGIKADLEEKQREYSKGILSSLYHSNLGRDIRRIDSCINDIAALQAGLAANRREVLFAPQSERFIVKPSTDPASLTDFLDRHHLVEVGDTYQLNLLHPNPLEPPAAAPAVNHTEQLKSGEKAINVFTTTKGPGLKAVFEESRNEFPEIVWSTDTSLHALLINACHGYETHIPKLTLTGEPLTVDQFFTNYLARCAKQNQIVTQENLASYLRTQTQNMPGLFGSFNTPERVAKNIIENLQKAREEKYGFLPHQQSGWIPHRYNFPKIEIVELAYSVFSSYRANFATGNVVDFAGTTQDPQYFRALALIAQVHGKKVGSDMTSKSELVAFLDYCRSKGLELDRSYVLDKTLSATQVLSETPKVVNKILNGR